MNAHTPPPADPDPGSPSAADTDHRAATAPVPETGTTTAPGTGTKAAGGTEAAGGNGPEVGNGPEAARGPAAGDGTEAATEVFLAHRSLLFTVAYEVLGSAADAEDVVQETWLRWAAADRAGVLEPRAYLVRIATRQALNRLRTVRRLREAYVGPWLPEPLLTAPDVAEDAELADSVSTALMLVLETLSPTERAVFVLREVFDVGYGEIAEAVGKAPAAVRQIAHRARGHVEARRPRRTVAPAAGRAALESFRQALETGNPQGLLDVLAPDVVLMSDGGGVKQAARRPVLGADKVSRYVMGWGHRPGLLVTAEPAVVNGGPALVLHVNGEADGVLTASVEDGRITALYYVRNPQKLTRVSEPVPLTLR
ncbi:RNA polymerase sigma-70 factor [Streptomyces sp. NPDC097619]|uniref:RNA polymerase sigma-70 factor n=1 Tax=Streptomyces sp. NPDC097619 TaxID=3157228 RepID=UPI00332DFA0A